MIIFNYEKLDNFLTNLIRRVGNEVFAHFIEGNSNQDEPIKNPTLILQYLGRVDPSLLALHQCVLKFQKKEEKDAIIQTLLVAFEKAGGIQLVSGKIQEMIMSLA